MNKQIVPTDETVVEQENSKESQKLSAQEVETSKSDEALKKCEQEAAEWKDKFFRVSADFQNYKKRFEKEQSAFTRSVKANLLLEILTIVDNFDRALENQGQDAESLQTWLEGFELIRKDLYKFLEKHGISQIESYENFDPELHEAVMQVEADGKEPGQIVEVLQKGYFLNDTVLRPAKVSVAK